jgi:Fe2+ transport system protein FeoA
MNISEAPIHSSLLVTSFHVEDSRDLSEIESRLMHLGFINGAKVTVKKKAPIFKEPILVEVRGRMIALTLSEAALVQVEVM